LRSSLKYAPPLLSTGAGEPRPLPGGGILQYHWAAFFPSSSRILFAAEDKSGAVRSYLQDLDGSPPKPFAEEGMRATIVSPDGLEIAGSTLEGLQLIYRADGEVRMGLIDEIAHAVDPNLLIFEAPRMAQQVWFLHRFGAECNLGNIVPTDVLSLETLRLGLRSDTAVRFGRAALEDDA